MQPNCQQNETNCKSNLLGIHFIRYNVGSLSVFSEHVGEVFGLNFGLIVTCPKFGFLSSKPSPGGSGKLANNRFNFRHWRKPVGRDSNFLRFPHYSFPNPSNSYPSWISAWAPSNKVKYSSLLLYRYQTFSDLSKFSAVTDLEHMPSTRRFLVLYESARDGRAKEWDLYNDYYGEYMGLNRAIWSICASYSLIQPIHKQVEPLCSKNIL